MSKFITKCPNPSCGLGRRIRFWTAFPATPAAHSTPTLPDLIHEPLGQETSGGLHSDNACAGCHSPTNGFGDTQSIAIGIQNNNLVGRNRFGPRNQRRTPMAANTAFFPALMWNERFFAVSGDPFDNSGGFVFPPPEGATRFPRHDPVVKALLPGAGPFTTNRIDRGGGVHWDSKLHRVPVSSHDSPNCR